jgi:hypothetical protein
MAFRIRLIYAFGEIDPKSDCDVNAIGDNGDQKENPANLYDRLNTAVFAGHLSPHYIKSPSSSSARNPFFFSS